MNIKTHTRDSSSGRFYGRFTFQLAFKNLNGMKLVYLNYYYHLLSFLLTNLFQFTSYMNQNNLQFAKKKHDHLKNDLHMNNIWEREIMASK